MKISVIIPTLDEAARIGALVEGLRQQDPDCEIVVADGGSRDATACEAAAAGARVTLSEAGRGHQLARGADLAQGETLLFLHADTRFPADGLAVIRLHLADPSVIGGNFRVLFDGDDDFSRWLDGFYAWFRRKGLYYGDSAVFVRRELYRALGGIRPIALMEDFDFTRRMERCGGTVCIHDPPVVTSSRRFAGRKPAAIVSQWLFIHAAYSVGVPPSVLARLYDSARRGAYPGAFKRQS